MANTMTQTLCCVFLFTVLTPCLGHYCPGLDPGNERSQDSTVGTVTLAGTTKTINNTQECPGGTGIQWFPSEVADLHPGQKYTLYYEVTTCENRFARTSAAWIDFNGDQVFDDWEKIGEQRVGGGIQSSYITLTITVPSEVTFSPSNRTDTLYVTASQTPNLRLRVQVVENGFEPYNPCLAFPYGGVKDFPIIGSSVPVPTPAPRAPIIAVVAHPFNSPGDPLEQYIAASYVKWIEAAGGRVVPFPYNANMSYVETLLKSTNGLLLPGGGALVSPSVKFAFRQIISSNALGDHYPIWGTCLGFEWLIQLAGGDITSGFDSENISLPLKFVNTSRIFTEDMIAATQGNIAFNNHGSGITPDSFTKSNLPSFFNLVATSTDRQGKEFVSVVEGISQPIYATQFHPEKSPFEWSKSADGHFVEAINHGAASIEVMNKLAEFFVNEARKNTHEFASPAAEQSALIWNYPVTYTGPGSGAAPPLDKIPFTQAYFFKNWERATVTE